MIRTDCRKSDNIRSDRGFTLVELIVVLAVIAIISSAAVLSIIGYIDKARFDKNEQNAQSVFQAAQASVNHKKIDRRVGRLDKGRANERRGRGSLFSYEL